MSRTDEITVREYGGGGQVVIVLHGGPAAAGNAALLARGLARDGSMTVLEPWQRGSGDEPLTVARHVADLQEIMASRCGDAPPALVGESWGAMLALACAAAHPTAVAALALVGCGTWDSTARARLQATIDERMTPEMREGLTRLARECADPGERMKRKYDLLRPLYVCDPIPRDQDCERPQFDERAHRETWQDMVRLQEEGVYPAAFAGITAPVIMLHGDQDPHPGRLIRDSLKPYLPQLEYVEFMRCGHSPWLERSVREEFFATLAGWLGRHSSAGK